MKIYRNFSTDPSFNLACEEYLLFHEVEPVFMLWQNERSVIIGQNQNAYAEIDLPYVTEHGIKVVRRLSGGGAVYHDLGNLNYTFIVPEKESDVLNFATFAAPIISALATLGVTAELSGRNDLTIDGKKISGNAQCVKNGRILHHGTLLISSDLSVLSSALRVDPTKFQSKGIASVRSRVTNLSKILPKLDVPTFRSYLESQIEGDVCELTAAQKEEINSLAERKYRSWEWNFGRSRAFEKRVKERFSSGTVEIAYNADCGIIKELAVYGDFFTTEDLTPWQEALHGCRLDPSALREHFRSHPSPILGVTDEDLISLILR